MAAAGDRTGSTGKETEKWRLEKPPWDISKYFNGAKNLVSRESIASSLLHSKTTLNFNFGDNMGIT